ncbi:putative PHD finger protein, partial [Naja naja]
PTVKCLCKKEKNNFHLKLRCDECRLCYHFGCLDPPLKKSPKQTGYGWICQECDSSSSKGEVDGMKNKYQVIVKHVKLDIYFLI